MNAFAQANMDYTSMGGYVQFFVSYSGVTLGTFGGPDGRISEDAHDLVTISGATGDGVLTIPLTLRGTGSTNSQWYTPVAGFRVVAQGQLIDLTSPGSAVLDVPFTFGVPFVLDRFLDVGIDTSGISGPTGPVGGTADYLHTASLGPMLIRDHNGQVVLDATATSSDGFSYPLSSDAPEPGTVALMSAGIVALLLRRRINGFGNV